MSTPTQTGPGTTAQHALTHLRDEIVSGALVPGARIGQESVAGRLGISLAPVREALRILEREGQVTYRPRRGYIVTELNMADLEEIYALRALLEREAAYSSLPELTEEDLAAIEHEAAACAAAVSADDVVSELAANRRFHHAILAPAGRPHLQGLIDLLWDQTEAYRAIYYNSSVERRESLRAHDRILGAVVAGDPERLAAELDAHRERALVVLRRIIAAPGPVPAASGAPAASAAPAPAAA
jgi:DNA-binding GntR family transcriptional regulator